MKKVFLLLLASFSTINAFSKAPEKKTKVSKEWPFELKGEVSNNLVKKGNQPTILLNLEKKDEVTLKVLAKGFAADSAIWKFSVKTKAGKNVKIDYDAAAKVWFFKREPEKQYVVFVSKRKNNIESVQWLWFEI
jgi:hypothetical protein